MIHWLDTFEQSIVNLKRIFPSAHLLIMFRRQGDFIVSLWRSHLMMGEQEAFEDFYGPAKLFREQDFLIAPKLEIIRREFGESASFLSFEEFKQHGPAYLDSFFGGQGICRDKGVKTRQRPNPSFNGAKLRVVRRLNRLYGRLPNRVRQPLARAGIKPKILMQRGLPFWNPREEPRIRDARIAINEKLSADYDIFLTQAFLAEHQG